MGRPIASNIRSHSSVDSAYVKRAYAFWRSPRQHMLKSSSRSHNRHSVCTYTSDPCSVGIRGAAKSGDAWRWPSSDLPPSLGKPVEGGHLRWLAPLLTGCIPGCLGPHADMGDLLSSGVAAGSVAVDRVGGACSCRSRVGPSVSSHADALRSRIASAMEAERGRDMAGPVRWRSCRSTGTTLPTLASVSAATTPTAKRAA